MLRKLTPNRSQVLSLGKTEVWGVQEVRKYSIRNKAKHTVNSVHLETSTRLPATLALILESTSTFAALMSPWMISGLDA